VEKLEIKRRCEHKMKNIKDCVLANSVEFVEKISSNSNEYYSSEIYFQFCKKEEGIEKLILDTSNIEGIHPDRNCLSFVEKRKREFGSGKQCNEAYYGFNIALDDVLQVYESKGIDKELLSIVKNKYLQILGDKVLDCFGTVTVYENTN
jgi:hypothetical protein